MSTLDDNVSGYLKRPLRAEEEARADCEAAKQMFASMFPKVTYQCHDCGAWWRQHGTAERCPTCKCPSPSKQEVRP
jgi:rubrerythrin